MNFSKEEFKKLLEETGETGFVQMVSHPIVYVTGLPSAHIHEVVTFETGEIGWILSLMSDMVEILVLSTEPVGVGVQAVRTGRFLEVPVGEGLLGNSVDSLGRSLYAEKPIHSQEYRSIDSPAPGISARAKVSEPLETGVAVIDMTIPLGKGQRELVVGDRKTGKTEFLLQTLLMQGRKGTLCIYACIGKKKTDIRKVENFIKQHDLSANCFVIASSSSDPLGMIYITPYSAMTMAEYYRDQGREVLLILDDLTTHARFYREISLICKKFPGRSSYPGDVFYTHSRLLERAGNFMTDKGVVSLTCLPVAETVEGDISGYIQTNIMSITDGHIYFDREVFDTGRRPAVNYFLSVTRVGRQTQSKLRWTINRELFSFLTLYDKTQDFVHFGAELNEGIKATLGMGDKILTLFNQPMGKVLDLNLQIILFCLIWAGILTISDTSSAKIVLERAVGKYESEPDFKTIVDTLVTESADLNDLLGKVQQQRDKFTSLVS